MLGDRARACSYCLNGHYESVAAKKGRCGRWNLCVEARDFQETPRRFPANRPYDEQTTPYGTGARRC